MILQRPSTHRKYIYLSILIVACIATILIYISITSYDRYIWETKSAEEIGADIREIKPVPDNILIIPGFDGKYPIPIIEFACDHFMESWHFIIYNDGSLFLDDQYFKKIPLAELKDLISELNNKGLYDISEWGINIRGLTPNPLLL